MVFVFATVLLVLGRCCKICGVVIVLLVLGYCCDVATLLFVFERC